MFLLNSVGFTTMVKAVRVKGDTISFLTKKEGSKTGNITITVLKNNLSQDEKYRRILAVLNKHLVKERMRAINTNIEDMYYKYTYLHGEQGAMNTRISIELKDLQNDLTTAFKDILTLNGANSNLVVKRGSAYDPKPPKVEDPELNGIFLYQVINDELVIEQCLVETLTDKEDGSLKGYNIKGMLTHGYSIRIPVSAKNKSSVEDNLKFLEIYNHLIQNIKYKKGVQLIDASELINAFKQTGLKINLKGWGL